jgi:hypothetical protein
MAVIADMALYPDVARYFGPPPVPLREGEEIELESTEPPTGPAITYSELGEWLRGTGVVPYEPSEADLDNATEAGTIEVGATLREAYPGSVGAILFEEWLFLQSHSWLAARRRWVFNRFIWAGGIAVEVGRRGYESAVARARTEMPRLLTRAGIKGAARWIARSGSTALASTFLGLGKLEEAVLTKAVGKSVDEAAKRIFLLIDP